MKLFNLEISLGLLFIEKVEDEFNEGFLQVFEDFHKDLSNIKTNKSLKSLLTFAKFLKCAQNAHAEIEGSEPISKAKAVGIFEKHGINSPDTKKFIEEMSKSITVVLGDGEEKPVKKTAKKKAKKK